VTEHFENATTEAKDHSKVSLKCLHPTQEAELLSGGIAREKGENQHQGEQNVKIRRHRWTATEKNAI